MDNNKNINTASGADTSADTGTGAAVGTDAGANEEAAGEKKMTGIYIGLVDLTLDSPFKTFLMRDPQLCARLLRCYISELRKRKIKKVTFLTPEPQPGQPKAKQPRLDAVIELDDHEMVNVEMQYIFQHFFCERALFYWATSYIRALKKGDKYSKLRPTYMVVFTHFDISPELKDRLVSTFSIRCNEKEGVIFSEHFKIVVVNLKRLKGLSLDEVLKLDKGSIMGYLIGNSSNLTLEDLERIKQVDDDLREAGDMLQELSGDELVRALADAEEKHLRDMAGIRDTGEQIGFEKGLEASHAEGVQMGIVKGREEGREEGRAEGREEGREEGVQLGIVKGREEGELQKQIDIARSMLAENESVERVCRFTGLSAAEVRKL